MRILVTRPRAQAEETARRLRAAGHSVQVAPMLEIAPIPGPPIALEGVQALLLTSANGARHGLPRLEGGDRRVLCVGTRTAEAARAAGVEDVESAGGEAADLAAYIARRLRPADGALLHLCGRHRRANLKRALKEAGFTLREAPVYEARESTDLPEDARQALEEGDIDLIVFYSARSARRFLALADVGLRAGLAGCAAAVMSPRVAGELDGVFRRVLVADTPDEPGMMRAVEMAASTAPK